MIADGLALTQQQVNSTRIEVIGYLMQLQHRMFVGLYGGLVLVNFTHIAEHTRRNNNVIIALKHVATSLWRHYDVIIASSVIWWIKSETKSKKRNVTSL